MKLLRYPEGNQLRALDPRLRGDGVKNTPMPELGTFSDHLPLSRGLKGSSEHSW